MTMSRPVEPRARRIADIAASVPDDVSLIISKPGTRAQMGLSPSGILYMKELYLPFKAHTSPKKSLPPKVGNAF